MSESLQGLSAYLRAQAVALDAIPRQAFGGEAARSAKTLRDWADEVDALVATSTPEPELFEQAWPMPASVGYSLSEAQKSMLKERPIVMEPAPPFILATDDGDGDAVMFDLTPHPSVQKIAGQLKEVLGDVLARQQAAGKATP